MSRKKKTSVASQTALSQLSQDLETVLAQNQKGLAVKQARTFNMLKVFFALLLVVGVLIWFKGCLAGVESDNNLFFGDISDELVERYEADKEDYRFLWTAEDFNQIQGSFDQPGDTVEDIIARYGQPNQVEDHSTQENLELVYQTPGATWLTVDDLPTVRLSFTMIDGSYRLTQKSFYKFPPPDEVLSLLNQNGAEWTATAFDQLKVGTETGLGGEDLNLLLETYHPPANLTLYVSLSGRELTAIYHGNQSSSYYIRLRFVEAADGSWLLIDKVADFE